MPLLPAPRLIDPATVPALRWASILGKLHVQTRQQAVLLAEERGWI